MSKVFFQCDHPVLADKLAKLRDKNTDSFTFRTTMREVSKLLAYEATRDLHLKEVELETPVSKCRCYQIKESPMCISILRAGEGMLAGVLETIPQASAGHIGIYRDKFINNTVEYYFKMPENCKDRPVLLLDPLVATGDTVLASIERLKQYEVGKIKLLCLLISAQGIERVQDRKSTL